MEELSVKKKAWSNTSALHRGTEYRPVSAAGTPVRYQADQYIFSSIIPMILISTAAASITPDSSIWVFAAMRTATSGLFQKRIYRSSNPENTFDYTPALIQFVMSCPRVDEPCWGMRSVQRVEQMWPLQTILPAQIDIVLAFRITRSHSTKKNPPGGVLAAVIGCLS